MSEQESTTPISESNDRRRLFIGLGILAGIIFVIVVVVVILLFVDPFGWDLLGMTGKDAAAEAIPAEAAMYIHVNLDRLGDENLEAIIRALSPEPLEEGTTFLDQQLEELDDWLSEEMNITYSEDIQPWIGNDVGLGISDLAFDLYGTAGQEGILFAVEVDDKSAADEFLEQIITELEERSGATVEEETYADQTIYFLEDDVVDNVAICRSENLLLIGESVVPIHAGIDAQNGASLADLDSYQNAIDGLPGGEILTMYMDMAKYYESMTPLVSMAYGPGMSDLMSESSAAAVYVAVGISAVDVGVKIDYAILTDPELQAELPEGYLDTDPKIPSMAPEDTIMYLVSGIVVEDLEQTRENLLQLLSSQGSDAEEALTLFAMSFGFDPIDDLIGSLDGEIALLLLPSAEGLLAESMDIPLGFALLAETNKPQKLLTVADNFSAAMERQGMGEVEVSEEEFGTIYDLVDMFSGDLIVTYGVGEEHLMIGSSSSVFADLFSGGPSLAESEAYQEIWDAFPRDMVPMMYLNIEGLIGQIRESMEPWEREDFDEEAGAILKAMKAFAAAMAPVEDNLSKMTIILFIETE